MPITLAAAADDSRAFQKGGRLTSIAFERTLISPWQKQKAQAD
jgi:hypothetical protein